MSKTNIMWEKKHTSEGCNRRAQFICVGTQLLSRWIREYLRNLKFHPKITKHLFLEKQMLALWIKWNVNSCEAQTTTTNSHLSSQLLFWQCKLTIVVMWPGIKSRLKVQQAMLPTAQFSVISRHSSTCTDVIWQGKLILFHTELLDWTWVNIFSS